MEPDPFTTAMLRDMDALEEPKPGSVARVLQPLLQAHACPTLRLCCPRGCVAPRPLLRLPILRFCPCHTNGVAAVVVDWADCCCGLLSNSMVCGSSDSRELGFMRTATLAFGGTDG